MTIVSTLAPSAAFLTGGLRLEDKAAFCIESRPHSDSAEEVQ